MSERGPAVWARDAWELADEVRAGARTAKELLEVHLERVERLDAALNAVCHLHVDEARARAEAVDADVTAGRDPGPLAGVPVGVKVLAGVRGWPDTEASRVYEHRVAAHDDVEIARLRAAGAVLVGQTTASELGSVSFTSTPLYGVTRNPWDTARTPGGSSGGSAAAVAAGLFPVGTGGDGGGSIRIPSAYCGLPGMKTTSGFAGTGPGMASFSLMSVHGPIVRSVRDAARYLDVIAGPTLTDPQSLPRPARALEPQLVSGEAIEALRGRRAVWSSTLGYAGAEPAVAAVAREAAEALVDAAGLELVDVPVELPAPGRSWTVLGTVNEMARAYEELRDRVQDLTEVLQMAVASFEHLRPDVLLKAVRGRWATVAAAAAVFEEVDLLLTPTTPTTAFEAEGRLGGVVDGAPVTLMGLSAAFAAPFNLTGQPACSIPAGLVDGVPVGLQVVARRHEDVQCLAAAALLEQVRPWPKLAPLGVDA